MVWSLASYSSSPSANTNINGININEGCAPSGINDAIRQLMADIATQGVGNYNAHGADIASAATVNLDTATGNYVHITGAVGITAITLADGKRVTTLFTGAPLLSASGALIPPTGLNYQVAAGDVITWVSDGGNVRAESGMKANGQSFSSLDSTFRLTNSVDPTKQIAFDASAIATGTTRTLAAPNVSGTIVTSGDTATVTNTMLAQMAARTVKVNATNAAGVATDFALTAKQFLICNDAGTALIAGSFSTGLTVTNGVVTASGAVVQEKSTYIKGIQTATGAVANVAFGATAPASTVGYQVCQVTINVQNATNLLDFSGIVNFSSAVQAEATTMIFEGTTLLFSSFGTMLNVANEPAQNSFSYSMVAATTGSRTFTLRHGINSATTMYINGVAAVNSQGGSVASGMRIAEVAP